jgi:hypothetical protein
MITKTITVVLVVASVALWVGWTLYAALNRVPGDTISEFVQGLALAAPFVALALGAVAGHWFGLPFNDAPLVRYVQANPGIAFLIGYIAGAVAWAMRR